MRKYFPVLSIAGSDSSGGAGIQADLKTISALGCYGMTAVTAITAQNTTGVCSIMPVTPQMVAQQIDMVMDDIPPLAVKLGMLCNAGIAATVAERLGGHPDIPVVLDPVMISTSGSILLEPEAVDIIINRLFPLSSIITPNYQEVAHLTGESDPDRQARRLYEMGASAILIKGGDSTDRDFKTDILYMDNCRKKIELKADAVDTRNTHGTGCTLSSAIASYLALGDDIPTAVRRAKLYISRAIEAGSFVTIGHGHGPVNHFFSPRRLKNYNPNNNSRS